MRFSPATSPGGEGARGDRLSPGRGVRAASIRDGGAGSAGARLLPLGGRARASSRAGEAHARRVGMNVVCPSCGQETPAGFPLCANCGAPLAAEAPSAREERKVVTVLFCDLVGFTGRAEAMDPEDVRTFLSGYHERVRHELERYGGTVEKFVGDAVMALFVDLKRTAARALSPRAAHRAHRHRRRADPRRHRRAPAARATRASSSAASTGRTSATRSSRRTTRATQLLRFIARRARGRGRHRLLPVAQEGRGDRRLAERAKASPRCPTTPAWTPTCASATRTASCARTAS